MVEANILKYISRQFIIGGFCDKTIEFPSKAIYIPSEEIIIMRDPSSMAYSGPAHSIYTAYLGPKAQRAYDKLVEKLSGKTPEKVDVPETFVAWAKALHTTLNPSKELSDILDVNK